LCDAIEIWHFILPWRRSYLQLFAAVQELTQDFENALELPDDLWYWSRFWHKIRLLSSVEDGRVAWQGRITPANLA
jgi:hypothetical protein